MKASEINYVLPLDNSAKGKIVLVGMLEDGPPGVGFSLPATKNAISSLGNNEMAQSHTYLIEQGIASENIILYRLNGIQSKLTLTLAEKEFFQFESIGANKRDNGMTVTVSALGVTVMSQYDYLDEEGIVNQVEEKMNPNFKRTYLFSEYPYLSDLSGIINQDAALGLIDLVAKESVHGKCTDWFTKIGVFPLSEGNSESNMCTVFENLPEGYEELYWPYFEKHVLGEDYDGDSYTNLAAIEAEIIHFTDIQFDKMREVVFFTGKLAEQKTANQDILCSALLHASPVPKKFEIPANDYFVDDTHYFSSQEQGIVDYVPFLERDAYIEMLENLFTNDEREPTYWQNVQLLIGEDRSNEENLIPGSLYHAAIYLNRPFYLSLSNQELTGFNELNVELPKSLIARIQEKGYTCIVPSIRKNMVCAYVQNMAYKKGLLLENFNNQRLLSYLTKDIKVLLEEFIGRPKSYFSSSTVVLIIEEYLSQFVASDTIASYSVRLPEGYQTEDGAFIEISLSLYNEVKQLSSQLSVSKEGWEVDLWNLTV